MGRPRNVFPTYRRHGAEARCWVGGKWVSLGRYDTPESRAEFARIRSEVAASPAAAASIAARRGASEGATLAEVIEAFKAHAETYYVRADGTQTTEVDAYKQALKVARRLYGDAPAAEFGPRALKAVRAEMVRPAAEGGLGWSRLHVNAQVGRIRRVFKWAVAEELVPEATFGALALVAGLRKNRTPARESDPVRPVPDADYRATLPHLVPTVRAMVQLNRLSGMRAGEIRLLTPRDIDTSGEVWVFRPDDHKTSYRGAKKAIPLPPAARAVLEPRLKGLGPTDLVFTPAAATAEMFAAKRANRKSKVQPSQADRRKPASKKVRRVPPRWTTFGYCQNVARACKRAGVPEWSPGQLRHSFATEVRERFGLEAAQTLLGHARADVTQVYAERNMRLGLEAAKALG